MLITMAGPSVCGSQCLWLSLCSKNSFRRQRFKATAPKKRKTIPNPVSALQVVKVPLYHKGSSISHHLIFRASNYRKQSTKTCYNQLKHATITKNKFRQKSTEPIGTNTSLFIEINSNTQLYVASRGESLRQRAPTAQVSTRRIS